MASDARFQVAPGVVSVPVSGGSRGLGGRDSVLAFARHGVCAQSLARRVLSVLVVLGFGLFAAGVTAPAAQAATSVTLVGSSACAINGSGSCVVSRPTGSVSGDLFVAAIVQDGTVVGSLPAASPLPAGFVAVGTPLVGCGSSCAPGGDPYQRVSFAGYGSLPGGMPPASVAFAHADGGFLAVRLFAFRGASGDAIVSGGSLQDTVSGVSVSAGPVIVPSGAYFASGVSTYFLWSTGTVPNLTVPTGLTGLTLQTVAGGDVCGGYCTPGLFAFSEHAAGTSGVTGSRTATWLLPSGTAYDFLHSAAWYLVVPADGVAVAPTPTVTTFSTVTLPPVTTTATVVNYTGQATVTSGPTSIAGVVTLDDAQGVPLFLLLGVLVMVGLAAFLVRFTGKRGSH